METFIVLTQYNKKIFFGRLYGYEVEDFQNIFNTLCANILLYGMAFPANVAE